MVSECSSWLKTAYSGRIGAPKGVRIGFYAHLCQQGEKWSSHSTASQDNCHVYNMSQIYPPTSPYLTIFASAKPIIKTERANW